MSLLSAGSTSAGRMAKTKNGCVTTSFALREDLYHRLVKRLPRWGDRTKVLSILVVKFLNNEVEVVVPRIRL